MGLQKGNKITNETWRMPVGGSLLTADVISRLPGEFRDDGPLLLFFTFRVWLLHCGPPAVFLLVAETMNTVKVPGLRFIYFFFYSLHNPVSIFPSASFVCKLDLQTSVLFLRTWWLLPLQKADRCVSCLRDHRCIVLFPAHNLSSSNSLNESFSVRTELKDLTTVWFSSQTPER